MEYSEEVKEELKEKEAQGNLKTAEFYEKQKKPDSARIYYQEIVNNCSYCASATIAREKLKELEKKRFSIPEDSEDIDRCV